MAGSISFRPSRDYTLLYWKDNARGVVAGLTRYANKGHIARAVLEATAFQTRDVLEAMGKDSNIRLDALRADGGMVEDELLMQFQSDILNLPVVRPVTRDATTALGSAYAAGLARQVFQGSRRLAFKLGGRSHLEPCHGRFEA